MNKFFKTFAAMIMLAGILMLNVACEGPEGPAGADGTNGKDGVNGKDGKDGAASCVTCHNMSTDLKSKILQWSQSAHGAGVAYIEEGNRNPCATCHSSEGFEQMMAGVNPVVPPKNPTNINCRTCHTIHNNFDMTDFAVRYTNAVTLTGDMTEGQSVNIGAGNICVNCHQSRPRNYKLELGGEINVSSTYWGPHGSTQTNVLMGNGGYEMAGENYPSSMHKTSVTDGCVQCHMYEGAHNFEPHIATCTPCHTDAKNFDIGGVQTNFDTALKALEEAMLAKGLVTYNAATDTYTTKVGKYDAKLAGVIFNWELIEADGSRGVHNPKYVAALIAASMKALQ